jgi:CubicO group peptidase (beta-lactamase class C family)
MQNSRHPNTAIRSILALSLVVLGACSDSGNDALSGGNAALAAYADPGIGPWQTVPRDQLIAECGLDPDILDEIDQSAPYSYAVVRYGKLCHEFYHPDDPGPDEQFNNFSATKTLAATLVGRTVLLSENLPRPLRDTDRMDSWISDITFNPDALVAHVLAMLGFNDSLAFGQRTYAYDASGQREINRLSDVLEAVIAQDPAQFSGATTTQELARRELFNRLGMDNSSWDGESFGSTWHSDLHDMARLGLLLVHNGVWNQQQLVSQEWVYKMTHPAFEDANTAYGYLTWLAASRNYYLPGLDINFQQPLADCQPDALWPQYPHTLSESTDCNYDGAYSCTQTYDVGAFAAAGAGGQLIVGHRALDLVLVTRNAGIAAFISTPWELMRRALIAHDPVYAGDEEAFCAAYGAGEYAPDLITAP